MLGTPELKRVASLTGDLTRVDLEKEFESACGRYLSDGT